MSLWDSNVMFLFYEVTDIPRSRAFVENALGLELIENRFHPPHERHGVAKYDAGNVILALNLAVKTFVREASDGIVTVFGTDPRHEARIYARLFSEGLSSPLVAGDVFPDHDRHEFAVRSVRRPADDGESRRALHIEEIRYTVEDVGESVAFYHEVLGLPVLHREDDRAQLAAANLRLLLHRRTLSPPVRHDGLLTVFYAAEIEAVYASLEQRGMDFRNKKVRYSDIGGSVRFLDPDGHSFCLYEPSEECLSWESGPKVQELMGPYGTEEAPTAIH